MFKKNWAKLWYILLLFLIGWISIFILWYWVSILFKDVPSNQVELKSLIELNHWVLFYIFTCFILIYILSNSIWVIYSLFRIVSLKDKFGILSLYLWFILLAFLSFILPIVSYLIIWNNVYSDFSFSFIQMLNYIWMLEILVLFVVVLEIFFLKSPEIPIISFLTRVWLYAYLLYLFW